jgi:predicted MFS family arabinose efflux permease
VMLFSLFGGVIVDRFHKKDLLIFTNIGAMVLALVMAALVFSGHIQVWMIATMAFFLGTINALDMPTRQAFTIEMVGREALPSAISLNMGMFNSSRVIGPALAGLLITTFGIGGAYFLNGISFIAPIIMLLLMTVTRALPREHPHPIDAIKEGVKYTAHHTMIRSLIIFMALFSIFGFSYSTILPFIAKNLFNQDAAGLGIMYSASGLGALIGAFTVYPLSKKFSEIKIIVFGTLIFLVSLIAFSATRNYTFALVTLFIQGISMSLPFAMVMSTIQHRVDNHVRGRVSSISTLAFLGMQPIGAFQVGFFADKFGSPFAIQLGAFITFLALLFLIFSLKDQKNPALETGSS